MTASPVILLFSCEHAGNHVPRRYRHLFAGHEAVLQTHRAYDLGIYPVAWRLTRRLNRPLFACCVTRLLIDVNRSIGHRFLFSEFSRGLSIRQKQDLLDVYYRHYREGVTDAISQHTTRGHSVLHVSLHSFTPVLSQCVRNADIGLLYDPKRPMETRLARHLQGVLGTAVGLRVRRNYPYRGIADGFVTFLRKRFAGNMYTGLEIELNQRLFKKRGQAEVRPLIESLAAVFSDECEGLLYNRDPGTITPDHANGECVCGT